MATAFLAPLVASGTGAATAATAMQVVGGLASTAATMAQAGAAKRQAENNAFIGRTRALQTDASARSGLESELGTMRAIMGANNQGMNVGTFEMFRGLRANRDRERSVAYANQMQEAAGFRAQARAAGTSQALALPVGLARTGQSIFDLYQLRKNG